MHKQSSEPRAGGGPRLERAVVLQLLRPDHAEEWSAEELADELGDEMAALEEALGSLNDDGVLTRSKRLVSASRAARRLDELGLIAI
jgi:predicted transcriptional regulator